MKPMFTLEYKPDGKAATKGVDVNVTEAELDWAPEELIERIFTPAIHVLLADIKRRA